MIKGISPQTILLSGAHITHDWFETNSSVSYDAKQIQQQAPLEKNTTTQHPPDMLLGPKGRSGEALHVLPQLVTGLNEQAGLWPSAKQLVSFHPLIT